MHKFFNPESVVLIGAPRKTGPGTYNGIETMLRYGYAGRLYPINPKADDICGLKAYPSVAAVPEVADLALISVGRDQVIRALEQCIRAGIRQVIIISQGFSDADQHGRELQEKIAGLARVGGVRVVGPNTMGVLNNFRSFSTGFIDLAIPAKVPPVSLIAQTGLIQVASRNFAYGTWGKAIDIGNACDVDFVDLLEYFGTDPETRIIVLHMEGILRGREFLEIASRITLSKPIIVLKTGRSRPGARAALSHTGSLVGADNVNDAAFRRAGIIRVGNNLEMAVAIKSLLRFGELSGSRLGVITATGAAGIMAIDAACDFGLTIADLPQGLADKLKHGKPDWIHVGNPIDIWPLGMIGRTYRKTFQLTLSELMKSDDVDAVLCIIPDFRSLLHPDTEVFDVVRNVRKEVGNRKPVAMWVYMGNAATEERFEDVDGVACFDSVDQAVQGLSYCRQYHSFRGRSISSPKLFSYDQHPLAALLQKGRNEKMLMGEDALRFIAAFGIPVARGVTAKTWEEIESAAPALDYPLVLKVTGRDFLHKSDQGGVVTDIRDISDLRRSFLDMTRNIQLRYPQARIEGFQLQEQITGKELLLGLKSDPNFGHIVACGLGGIYTEVFQDISREIVPIGRPEAENMLTSLKIYPLLRGIRGETGVDRESVLEALERLSFLATEISDLAELDINPLIAGASGCMAVDARIIW
jgi:acetate---CoA ligase (ADP-forming)